MRDEQTIQPHPDPAWELVRQTARKLFKVPKGDPDLTPSDIEVWKLTFPGADDDAFRGALAAHARSGALWMPRAGELAPYLSPAPAPTSWPVLWGSVMRDCKRCKTPLEAARAVTEATGSERAGAFVASVWKRIESSPIGDPDNGGAIVASFRKEWESFNDAEQQRAERGLPATTAEQLCAPRGDLRRLGFASSLPQIEGAA